MELRVIQEYFHSWAKLFLKDMLIMKQLRPLFIRSSILRSLGSNLIKLTQLQSSLLTSLSQIIIKHLDGLPSSMLYLHSKITRLTINNPIRRHTQGSFESRPIGSKSIYKLVSPILPILMKVWWSSLISRMFRQEPRIKNKSRHQNTPCRQIRLHLTVKYGYGHLILGWLKSLILVLL